MDEKNVIPEIPSFFVTPQARTPEFTPIVDTPEKIAQDILRTEKEIASEALRMLRARYERERVEWDKILAEKERQILALGKQLNESEERLKTLEDQYADERAKEIEGLRSTMQDVEAKRHEDAKKWEMIAEEVKTFRESAIAAQSKLWEEQEKATLLKRRAADMEKKAKEDLYEKDEEIQKLNERLTAREESALVMQGRKDEEIHLLGEQLSQVQQTLQQERQYQGKVVEKKDSDLNELQKALQDTVIQLNLERQKLDENANHIAEQQKKIQELEDALRKTNEDSDHERTQLVKSFQEEQASWEKFKAEFVAKEEAMRRDAEAQIQRALKSAAILEQQLADEQLRRKEAEEKHAQKELEVQGLVSQKEGLIQEWKRILAAERETWQKQQDEILTEFDRIKKARETEFGSLRQELNNLHAALAEENRLFTLEKEENKQLTTKLQQLEENARAAGEQYNVREKELQSALMGDQELFKKQMEESKVQYETQIQSRDLEIYRLDEDLNLLNGQLGELRQKLSLEKSENNNRLDRIQELETEMKSFTVRCNQERAEWQKKLRFLQEQWEQQYRSMQQYQAEIEKTYKNDLQSYQERIKAMYREMDSLKKNSLSGEGENERKDPLISSENTVNDTGGREASESQQGGA